MTTPASSRSPSLWRTFLALATSLQVTIALLAFGMVLVFGATLDQTNLGIWGIQQKWFHTFLVHMDFRGLALPVFPGGYLIGGLLLGNLIAALAFRFAWSWKKAGLIVAHIGLILLLLGELLSGLWQQEYRLRLSKGESKDFVENLREIELAIVDSSAPSFDQVVAIPTSKLESHQTLQHRDLPFTVSTLAFFPNAVLSPANASDPLKAAGATRVEGLAQNVTAAPQPVTYRPDEENAPAAYLSFTPPGGTPVTLLVSTLFAAAQDIRVADKTYQVALRSARHYMPFKLRLLEFTHEKYAGTDIPKGFSSRVQIVPSNGDAAREVNIYMNHPLRHGGLTFYQAGFENNDRTTILQVVSNPSWQLPYVSCSLIALGLLVHFMASLLRFRNRNAQSSRDSSSRAPSVPAARSRGLGFYLPFGAVLLATLLAFLPGKNDPFGRLPVLVNGRIKPMDTVARSSLLLIQGRQSVKTNDGTVLTPSAWLLDMFFRPVLADSYPVFEITNNDVLSLLSLSPEDGQGGKRFAYARFSTHLSDLDRQAKLAEDVPAGERSTFQRHLLNLREAVALYQHLHYTFLAPGVPNLLQALAIPQDANGRSELVTIGNSMESMSPLHPLPPNNAATNDWGTFASAVSAVGRHEKLSPAATDFLALGLAWQKQDLSAFQEVAARRSLSVANDLPNQDLRTRVETGFNRSAPFYLSMLLYVGAFITALVSWLRWPVTLGRLAYAVTALAWILTTLGILCRMWLENRPPVTNLYSSALFVGWGSVGLCLYLEKIHRNGIGSAAAGLTGFATLLIAHHLSLSGDTMEMMRAVLDSNFWLATHVVTVTVGYSATFLAGFLGLFYLVRGLFTRSFDKNAADATLKMIVGIVAFATFFSFVGTVLGGIWADQSWGRFWGWDPKENGALLIVMWNAIVLHARWGGYVKARGIVALVLFGNVVTAWSWFGVNMLGVGLHSYGFMDSAMWWLVGFAALQVLAMALAGLPLNTWRSSALWNASPKTTNLISTPQSKQEIISP